MLEELEEENFIIKEDIQPKEKKKRTTVFVTSNFGNKTTSIGYEFLATGEKNEVTCSSGKIYMMQGRQYYVPVNGGDLNSDDYNIKVHSDVADKCDVRYIRDGLAAIVPIRHNSLIKNGERLCILTPLDL